MIALLKSSNASGFWLRLVDQAAAEIGGRVIGVERDRALDVGHRNIEPPGLAIDQPAVGIGRSAIGIEADHLVEIGQCFVGLAGLRQCRAALVVGYRIVRAILDGLAERGEVDGRGELRRFFRLARRRQRAQIGRAATERHRNQCDGCGRSRTMTELRRASP